MKRNFLDTAIETIAPGIARRRMQERIRIDAMLGNYQERKYDGASQSRHTDGWYTTGVSSNIEVNNALVTLRNRSRDLARNNPYIKNALRVLTNNIVGTGILAEPKVSGRSGNKDSVKELWKLWAEKIKCDYDQRHTFYGLQALVIKTIQQSGEALVIRRRANSKYVIPLRLQVLEGDYINTGRFTLTNEWGGITWYGIAFDKNGERVGYWLWDRHPGEFATHDNFIKAEDVIHVYQAERPGQIRGVPETHASILRTQDLDDYEFSERIRAKVSSAMVAVVTSDENADKPKKATPYDTMEPGTFHYLNKGEQVEFSTPPTHNGYDEYVKNGLRGIAAGMGVTYESSTGDLSNVNFSSGRMGWLEFHRNVEHWRWNVLIPHLCDQVFDWFVEAAKIAGKIPDGATVSVSWTAPRREMLDPVKETKAMVEGLRAKTKTWSEAVRENGDNPEEVMEELKKELDLFKKAGLMPESMPEFDSERHDPSADKEAGNQGLR